MYYEEQLADLAHQREQMRTVIAKWWTLMGETLMSIAEAFTAIDEMSA
jgi:hypothetical protein